jgi:nucleoside-diphosphate-sugar epimerase
MNVFVTGATGWVGSHVIEELKASGHTVTGMARSDEGAAKLEAKGIAVHRGSLEDLASLSAGARAADAVIHTAFNHDFSKFAENGANEQKAIEALGDALAGTGKPLVVTSGVGLIAPGRLVSEDDARDPSTPFPRDPETIAASVAKRGVKVSIIRLPPSVHGTGDHGFVPSIIGIARQHGKSAYVGDGTNRWCGVHVRDAARVFRLALEKAADFAIYHAVEDPEGLTFRELATIIGTHLNVPVVSLTGDDIAAHFTWMAHFAPTDMRASSEKTQAALGWTPQEPTLRADIDSVAYFP